LVQRPRALIRLFFYLRLLNFVCIYQVFLSCGLATSSDLPVLVGFLFHLLNSSLLRHIHSFNMHAHSQAIGTTPSATSPCIFILPLGLHRRSQSTPLPLLAGLCNCTTSPWSLPTTVPTYLFTVLYILSYIKVKLLEVYVPTFPIPPLPFFLRRA